MTEMHVYSYARISTDMQSEASIPDQFTYCREFAATNAWTVAAEFSDVGISGASFLNRPGIQAALKALQTGDVLLITDLTRFSRDMNMCQELDRLKFRGVRTLGAQDGFDSITDTAEIIAAMSGVSSSYMRRMGSRRTHSAMREKAKRGEATGGKTFGDKALVQEIFQRFAEGSHSNESHPI
jgi:site-specific DNA recombinase